MIFPESAISTPVPAVTLFHRKEILVEGVVPAKERPIPERPVIKISLNEKLLFWLCLKSTPVLLEPYALILFEMNVLLAEEVSGSPAHVIQKPISVDPVMVILLEKIVLFTEG